jgi:hypothetical protein
VQSDAAVALGIDSHIIRAGIGVAAGRKAFPSREQRKIPSKFTHHCLSIDRQEGCRERNCQTFDGSRRSSYP